MENLQGKTNSELTYILRWCTDEKLRNAAWEMLRANLGLKDVVVEEKALMKQIADAVLSRPGSLDMGHWHCGTSHCLSGWACVLDPIAKDVEEKYNTEIAGCAVLPSYAHLFYSDNETVLKILEQIKNEN